MRHYLKTWPEYYKEVMSGNKLFEARKNDRDFIQGDEVVLDEWDPNFEEYTGRQSPVYLIGFVLYEGFGLEAGHCVFSLLPLGDTTGEGY